MQKFLTKIGYTLGLLVVTTFGLSLMQGARAADSAAPAPLRVGIAWQKTDDTLEAISNLPVNAKVLPQNLGYANLPLSSYPYTNGMLDTDNNGSPNANEVNFKTDQGTQGPIFGGKGRQGIRELPGLMWCGHAGGIRAGDFKVQVGLFTQSDKLTLPNGDVRTGTWRYFWQLEGPAGVVDVSDASGIGEGTSVAVSAYNPYRTSVYFIFVEDKPKPTYTIQGKKVERLASGDQNTLNSGFNTAQLRLDNKASATANPFYLSGLSTDKAHTVQAPNMPDWIVDGFTFYLGSPLSRNGSGNTVTQAANTVANKSAISMRWYYKPKPSKVKMGIMVRDPSTGALSNPCNSSDAETKALCGKGTLSATRITPSAALGGYATTGGGVPGGANNAVAADNLYYGTYNLRVSDLPSDWAVHGQVKCLTGQPVSCASSNTLTRMAGREFTLAVKPNNDQYSFFIVQKSGLINSLTIECGRVAGTFAGSSSLRAELHLEGVDGKIGNDITPGSFAQTIPDTYKDGIGRNVSFVIKNAAGSEIETIDTGTRHLCSNNASCSVNNVQDVFKNNQADVGDPGYNIKIKMQNTGQSIWNGSDAGAHQLSLANGTGSYWSTANEDLVVDDQGNVVSGSSYPTKPGEQYEFTLNLKIKDNVLLSSTIKLDFQMSAIQSLGGGQSAFGAICANNINPRNFYHPWLRVQNGGIGALGTILGQPEGSRGFRKSEPASANPIPSPKNDYNKEAQYIVMAVASGNKSFCSTNAYNYGRGDNVGSCQFGSYAFSVGGLSSADYIAQGADGDQIISQAKALFDFTSCNESTYNPAKENLRSKYTGAVSPGLFTSANRSISLWNDLGAAGNTKCGIVAKFDGDAVFGSALGTVPRNYTLSEGRATIYIEGNLTINANIVNSTAWTVDGSYATDVTKLNKIPNLGLIVKGDVTIGRDVTQIDATIYSAGRIKTCDQYANVVCQKPLLVKGGLSARGGFEFGRNYFDKSRVSQPAANFDFAPIDGGQAQGPYFGGPAEDVIGNGLSFILPPPGLEDYVSGYYKAKYLPGDLAPRF